MHIIDRISLEKLWDEIPFLLEGIEEGYKAISNGMFINAPTGHMHLDEPADVHIKFGHEKAGKHYLIKIASHFPNNTLMHKEAIDGMMILFSQKTGKPLAVFEDHGFLTQLRTALAGAVIAKNLGPLSCKNIALIGSGSQARLQLRALEHVISCRNISLWARDKAKAKELTKDKTLKNFSFSVCDSIEAAVQSADLIISTTSSRAPLIQSSYLKKGCHITAIGSDAPGKQELDPLILQKADFIYVDSYKQCSSYGELSFALKNGLINENKAIEIGKALEEKRYLRSDENQLTVADLTGIAASDLKIAQMTLEILSYSL